MIRASPCESVFTCAGSVCRVAEAYASHDKMRCVFNPAKGVSLKAGLERTIAAMKAHGAAEPKG